MSPNVKLGEYEKGKHVHQRLYRSMIESLLYLTASRPEITYSVGVCAWYQVDPQESHVTAVKRIMTNDTNSSLPGYSGADCAGNQDDRKSTTEGCFHVGNNLVAWHSKKQNSISLSSAEAEYIAAGSCCTQLLWMKQMLSDYGIEQDMVVLYCDDASAISISKNPVQHSRTKHIDIRHHFIRELVENKVISIEHIQTEKQLADLFTKALNTA